MKKVILWTLLGGLAAYPIEGVWRIPSNGGWVSIFMLPVYGLCFLFVGSINQAPLFYKLSMRLQSLIGAAIVLLIEFVSGLFLNIFLKLEIWDYSHISINLLGHNIPLHLCGQICLLFGVFWYLLIPFAIWLEDRLNYIYERAYGRDTPYNYTLRQVYRELIFGEGNNRSKGDKVW